MGGEQGAKKQYLYSDRKWYLMITAYLTLRWNRRGYTLSRAYQIIFYVTEWLMLVSFITYGIIYLGLGDLENMVIPFHFALIMTFGISSFTTRHYYGDAIEKVAAEFRRGLYFYEVEEEDNKFKQIREKGREELVKTLNDFIRYVAAVLFFTFFIRPPLMYFTKGGIINHPNANPYLSLPLYIPWDTSTFWGYVVAEPITWACSLTFFSVVATEETYVGTLWSLKTELEVLSYSLSRMEWRASVKMRKSPAGKEVVDWESQEFIDSMYSCLRENAIHHIRILRLEKLLRRYTGLTLMLVFVCATTVIGFLCIIVITGDFDIFVTATFCNEGLVELIFVFRFFYFGEQLVSASEDVFQRLCRCRWLDCDRRFRKDLTIMIMGARRPLRVASPYFNVHASYQVYANLITTIYQFVNLARNAVE